MKGPDIIEIKTPPVVQISLTVAVSVDEFFIQNLISNLAYVLQIDVSRIRVVNIIAEDSLVDNNGRRRSVMSNNTISLEFGDPPGNSTDPPIQESSEADWLSGKGENDDVDIRVCSIVGGGVVFQIMHEYAVVYIYHHEVRIFAVLLSV